MYEDYFGVIRAPFHMAPDPGFLFESGSHRNVLAGLLESASAPNGIILLTGAAGTGKTMLLRAMEQMLPADNVRTCAMAHPTLAPGEFLEMLLLELGVEDIPSTKPRQLMALRRLLSQEREAGREVVLVLDEAHRYRAELLEEIRLLGNMDGYREQDGRLSIVLSGQSELDDLLDRPGLRQLKQRVAHRFALEPLHGDETVAYVNHRWACAGASRPHPFGEDALDYLQVFSGGIPRVINAICDNALRAAFVTNRQEVRPEDIVAVAKNLSWTQCNEESRRTEMSVVWDNPRRPAGGRAPA